MPIPPQASAIHQITDDDVSGCPSLEEVLPFYMDEDRDAGVDVFVAHKWAFEAQWHGNTSRAARPFAPTRRRSGFGRKPRVTAIRSCRYWLRPKGLDPAIASLPHRALPDAYVTAFILRELLELATVEELIAWTGEPALLPRVTFGRYRGSNWEEVPPDYLAWVADRSELGEEVKYTYGRHHRRLRSERARV